MLRRFSSVARDLSPRRPLLVFCVTLLLVRDGCTGFLADEDSGDEIDGDPVVQVPENATTLVHLNATAISADEGAQLLADLAAVESDRTSAGSGMSAFENRTGIDPLATNELLLFDTRGNETEVGYVVGDEATIAASLDVRYGEADAFADLFDRVTIVVDGEIEADGSSAKNVVDRYRRVLGG